MAHTVKQVAAMSGVSVRTLHFYDETGLLKPAYVGANGYRFYEEPQLLTLQQILFYRELGFELKEIKRILGRRGFEIATALRSHRNVLQTQVTRTRTLIETIDKTIEHLKGTKRMNTGEMFAGFSVGAGKDRFGERIRLHGETLDCKVSAKDTGGAMCAFEFTAGWPRHLHHQEDEWIYVLDGEWMFEVAGKLFRVRAGESVFIPRKVAHGLAPVDGASGKTIHVFQPAGRMEEFFRAIGSCKDLPTREDAINGAYKKEQINALCRLFGAHGMDLLGPPDPHQVSSKTQVG